MPCDHAVPPPARCSLFVVSFALAGTFAGSLLERPAPSFEAMMYCRYPAVEAPPLVAVPQPITALPQIGEVHRTVVADLLSRGPALADCGTLFVETPMVFTDVYADSATLRVLVPCAEMPRPMYSSSAGNAPVLQVQTRYRLELSGPVPGDRAGKNDALWRADRIDVVASPEPQRPAIGDVMCRNVWVESCGQRHTRHAK
jgi:hypothetical protein